MRRSSFTSEFLLHYIPAAFSIASTTLLLNVLRQALDTPLVALLYLLPVGLSASLWGLGAGVIAAMAAFLAFNYFFIKPHFTLTVHSPGDLVVLVVFLTVAVVISQLVGRARSGQATAKAREFEATQLYELSASLTGYLDTQTIVRIVAEQIRGFLHTEKIEFFLHNSEPLSLKLPIGASSPERQADLILPVQAGKTVLGEIRLWRATPLISASEKRLLKIFADQAAFALERAHLAEAESRAKVLEESDRMKTALLSSVSHELRTPLATIKAAATSLRSGEVGWDSKAREDLLGAVEDEADHLNLLVGNLLNMSRIEANQLKPERQWNLLSEIVASVLSRPHSSEGHKVEVDIPEDLPLLPMDFVQMEQVFTNLINNSFKYAPAGTTVRLSARVSQDSTVLVQVANQGPPVPAQDLERIFEKFHRITAADRVTGTGLGLSICKGIIAAHDGRIWAENLPAGFAINFTLPLSIDGKLAPQPPLEAEA